MTSDSSPSAEGTSGSGGGGIGTSYSQRNCLPSPWAEVVRGGAEPDPVAPRSPSASPSSVSPDQNLVVSDQLTITEPQPASTVETQPEASEGSSNGNASGLKKSAWNKPSPNGVAEGSTTPVMGASSWPALSEINRALPKSLSFTSESSKPTSDGSVTVSQAPVVSQQPQRPVRPHGNQNHPHHPVRQRSMKRGGGGGGGAGGGYTRPPPPAPPQPPTPPPMPRFPLYDMSYRGLVPAVLDTSIREQSPYNGNSFAPRPMGHSNAMNDHSSNRRRNNFGPRPRGDGGPYLNNGHGGRRDHHDRDWRGPAGIQPPMAPPPPPPPRGYMQQAHLGPAPFIAPQSIRPYGTPMGYEMAAPFVYVAPLPSEPYRGAPILPRAPPPPMFIPLVDTPLPVRILQQIEYYFSEANLKKDDYLKSNMDEEGWVPLSLIAGFRRVQSLTSDIQLILSSLRDSTVVEVQGENIRSRRDWQQYAKQTNGPLPEASLQNLTLADTTPGETSTAGSDPPHASSPKLANGNQPISNQDL